MTGRLTLEEFERVVPNDWDDDDSRAADAYAYLEAQPASANGSRSHEVHTAAGPRAWLYDAADLLAEPDPGPTAWLVDELITDRAIVAIVGRWKTTKSYGLLHLCISIATGEPAFGTLAIPTPGPVVYVCEESGRAAMWRRLDALCRGRAIDPDRLRGQLHVAANAGVKLDDRGWQDELVAMGREVRPRLIAFDPLARMKAPAREENAQSGMAEPIEFLRRLREETDSGVGFVHHTGHAGAHMRGSSDLESVWESRLTWTRDGQSPLVTIESEHREAEAGDPIRYRIGWDHDTRSMRFDLVADDTGLPPLADRVVDWLREHTNQKAEDVARGLEIRTSDVRRTLENLETAGTTHTGPSGRRDAAGRPIRDKVWNLTNQTELRLTVARPDTRTTQDEADTEHRGPSPRPTFSKGRGTDEPPDDPNDYPTSDDDIPF